MENSTDTVQSEAVENTSSGVRAKVDAAIAALLKTKAAPPPPQFNCIVRPGKWQYPKDYWFDSIVISSGKILIPQSIDFFTADSDGIPDDDRYWNYSDFWKCSAWSCEEEAQHVFDLIQNTKFSITNHWKVKEKQ